MPPKNNLARKLAKTPTFRTFAVSISPEVATAYEEQAGDADVGAVMSERLEDPIVVNHTSDKALYFSDSARQELERLMDYNFSNSDQVISRLRSLLTVIRVSDNEATEDLTLTPNRLFRLTERAKVAGMSITKYARKLALDGIDREIGLY